MELEKNGGKEKSFLGVLVFEHPCCSSINSHESKRVHIVLENTIIAA